MKILVGLSGGVDSSVAAYLMKKAGHEVIGATMSIWEKGRSFSHMTGGDGCFSPHEEEDIESARKICEILDIPYRVVDCTAVYKQTVLENFKHEYMAGRTPNPCVWCNAKIKFQALPDAAKQQGIEFDKFATGHYARVVLNEKTGFYNLLKGVDPKKDQSYFLYRLGQEQLARVMLPLGDMTKSEIRQIAREAGLPVSEKPDSQDFYTGDINDILQAEPKKGDFVTRDGKVLGHHNGFWNYTVGQRKGLGISAEKPLYVLGFDKEKNNVIVGFEDQNVCHGLTASSLNWTAGVPVTGSVSLMAKIRSSQQPTPVSVAPSGTDSISVEFENTQRGIAPGQSVVLYDGDLVVGGGLIQR